MKHVTQALDTLAAAEAMATQADTQLPASPSALASLGKLIADPPPERWDPPISTELWWSRNSALWTTARPIMAETLSRLELMLTPVSEAEVRRQLYKLSLGFAKASDDGDSWGDTAAVYVEHLDGFAAGAWEHAVRKWVRNRKTFYPSIGDLYGILEDWTVARRGELKRLCRTAELEPPVHAGECATLGEVLQLRAH